LRTIIPVTSLDLPALEPYRSLRETTHHWKRGFFVAESEKVVLRLMESRVEIASMLLSATWHDALAQTLSGPRFAETDLFVAPDHLLEEITGINLHKKIMAIGRIPENPTFESFVRAVSGGGVHVALEGIADAENMGTIVRTCAAFGVRSLLTGADSSSPWLRRSVRVSMGAVFGLRMFRAEQLCDTLDRLRREHGWRVIGTTPRGGVTTLAGERHDGPPLCLFFGSEGLGLSARAFASCDGRFSIPMAEDVDSLNVAIAVAVVLHEATRAGEEGKGGVGRRE
jgi:tRNA G18 (ribose-2'-O)-methylase SpoU